MNNSTWISTALGHPSNLRPFKHSFSNVEQEKNGLKWAQRNLEGDPLSANFFPSEIWGIKSARESNYKPPNIFAAGSFWVVSTAVADVLREFDLGSGGLFPVKVMKKDRATPIDGEWFCINFGNRKSAICPDSSKNIYYDYIRNGEKGWFLMAKAQDDDVAVSSSALVGPAI